jgi:hypothetical protein
VAALSVVALLVSESVWVIPSVWREELLAIAAAHRAVVWVKTVVAAAVIGQILRLG